jgi:TRAP-type mannitol/chloroaromatic compound transport system permease small subunit
MSNSTTTAAKQDYAPTALSRWVDPLLVRTGEAFSYIWVVLVLLVLLNVVLRYAFGKGLIQFEEAQWHLYAIGFMLGMAYVTVKDMDVRIDVLAERWSFHTRAWIELYGLVLFLIPFIVVVIWFAFPFIGYSLSIGERSDAPGGLPWRWAIKAVMLAAFALLALAAASRLSRVLAYLFLDRAPVAKA